MITNSCGGAIVVVRRPVPSPKCLAASVSNTEHLRAQLDQLHAEAESTRAKANSARMRLLRFSEAAENLRRQAAVNVQKGKEKDARELLFQKKKVMQALEKAKARIELLDQLSSKLNEAISVKETQVIGNIAVDLDFNGEDDSKPVRIVSPKLEFTENKNVKKDAPKFGDDRNSQLNVDSQASLSLDGSFEDLQATLDVGIPKEEDSTSSILTEVSSYQTFLEKMDRQLEKIEADLVTVLNVSSLVLNQEEKPKNLKVQQAAELLQIVQGARQRIVNIMCMEEKKN